MWRVAFTLRVGCQDNDDDACGSDLEESSGAAGLALGTSSSNTDSSQLLLDASLHSWCTVTVVLNHPLQVVSGQIFVPPVKRRWIEYSSRSSS